jgi:ClpP class serine protease
MGIMVLYKAMPTATMLVCAADKVVMGRASYLGPIHPPSGQGKRMIPKFLE